MKAHQLKIKKKKQRQKNRLPSFSGQKGRPPGDQPNWVDGSNQQQEGNNISHCWAEN